MIQAPLNPPTLLRTPSYFLTILLTFFSKIKIQIYFRFGDMNPANCETVSAWGPIAQKVNQSKKLTDFFPQSTKLPLANLGIFFEVEKLLICAHYARSLLFGGLILYRKSNICPKILTKREQFFFLSFFFLSQKVVGSNPNVSTHS